MIVLAGLVVVALAVMVVGSMARERPSFSTAGVAGLGAGAVLVLLVGPLLVFGLRGSGDPEPDRPSAPEPAKRVETADERPRDRSVEAMIRPGESSVLDSLPDASTKLVGVDVSEPVVLRQCLRRGSQRVRRCAPGTPAGVFDDTALGLVELERFVHIDGSDIDCAATRCALVAFVPDGDEELGSIGLVFGAPAERRPSEEPAPVPAPAVRVPGPDLPGGRLALGLAAGAALGLIAAWLIRRRPDEHPDDPFWNVSLDVPEWEGIDVTVDPDELVAP